MTDMNKIKISHSPLTDTILLYRHGQDEHLALDKRDVTDEVLAAVIDQAMCRAPNGSQRVVTLGKQSYLVRVRPLVKEPKPLPKKYAAVRMTKVDVVEDRVVRGEIVVTFPVHSAGGGYATLVDESGKKFIWPENMLTYRD